MAITKIPKIYGPDFGGVIYGLNLNMGYNSEPSTLTLDIVSKDGNYDIEGLNNSLNSQTSVNFGNFNFNGTIWSYSFKESSEEKTLQVILKDNSVILDRYYVLLWKRGFLGYMGEAQTVNRTYDFSDESILVLEKNKDITGAEYTVFKEKTLASQVITKTNRVLGFKQVQNLILVGREKFPESACDIPDTYYYFDDLRDGIKNFIRGNYPQNRIWRATHEGTLREVLQNWASDLGYDFYWDFSSNMIIFYNVEAGISNISTQDISASNIISKEVSRSMDGTFRQYGLAYTAKPRSPLKAITFTNEINTTYAISPLTISSFANRIDGEAKYGLGQSAEESGKQAYFGNRTYKEFINAAFLGYISAELRDIYSYLNRHWDALGYVGKSAFQSDAEEQQKQAGLIDFCRKTPALASTIKDLEKFDSESLTNYRINLIIRDKSKYTKWEELEQKLLLYHGKYYMMPDSSGSFFYCNSNYTIEVETTVDPPGQYAEENNEDYAGRRLFDRSGNMSHDQNTIRENLKYDTLSESIQKCAPLHIDIDDTILADLIASKILPENSPKYNTLYIYVKFPNFITSKIGFYSNISRNANNNEKTWVDIKNAQQSSGKKNCTSYKDTREKFSCSSYEEDARKLAIKAKGGVLDEEIDNSVDFVSGLVNKRGPSCNITLATGSAKVVAPSDAPYRVVCRYNITINKLSNLETDQFIWTVGSPGDASDVAEIRIANENITDPDEDIYKTKRTTDLIRPADVDCSTPMTTIKYSFAGDPVGVTLSPSFGLTSLDVNLSSDGYTTTASFASKPPKPSKSNNMVRHVQSQFNRSSYNAS